MKSTPIPPVEARFLSLEKGRKAHLSPSHPQVTTTDPDAIGSGNRPLSGAHPTHFHAAGHSIQAKLTVGAPDDAYEREADAMADRVVQGGHERPPQALGPVGAQIQRKCAACEEEKVQRKLLPITPLIQAKGNGLGHAHPQVQQGIAATRGGGMTLDGASRQQMEQGFGHDFGGVRIHTSDYAAQMSRDLNARAFTVGNDIYFNRGEYQPGTKSGQHLLAHELTHTVQQGGGGNISQRVQRAAYGGAQGAPATWSADVAAATTSAQKTALMQSALGASITVNDATAASAGDLRPDPAHLRPYTATSRTINFDMGLNTKQARVGTRVLSANGGYTFSHGGNSYVVMSPMALDAGQYFQTVWLVNHELDHVQQTINGSTLTGDSSEVDAWTSSFIREFHRSYVIRETNPTDCYIDNIPTYTPIQGYYERSSVPATEKTRAVSRIQAYFTATIQPHAGHLAAFKFWLRRSLNNPAHLLADDLISTLALPITTANTMASLRQFPCATVSGLTYPAAPSVNQATFPAAAPVPATPPSAVP